MQSFVGMRSAALIPPEYTAIEYAINWQIGNGVRAIAQNRAS